MERKAESESGWEVVLTYNRSVEYSLGEEEETFIHSLLLSLGRLIHGVLQLKSQDLRQQFMATTTGVLSQDMTNIVALLSALQFEDYKRHPIEGELSEESIFGEGIDAITI